MSRTDAAAWVRSLGIGGLRKSQAKTLAAIVAGALGAPQLTLAGLVLHLAGATAVKHKIKRVWRFIANDRGELPPLTIDP